jgi:AcrR family transcriptional regulator
MVQVLKQRVRDAFVAAGAETFAEQGYAATTMADVAARAGSSVGNLYKYFGGKQQLLEAAVPPELLQQLARLTRARMRALGTAKDVRELEATAEYHALAGELLDYCFAHRAAVVIVLARAEGTPFADFSGNFVDKLTQWALDYARGAYPALAITPALRFVLCHAYAAFVAAVAEALRKFPDEAEARAVIALLTSHHQGGLKRLFETEGQTDAHSHRPAQSSVIAKAPRSSARNAAASGTNSGPARPRAGSADRAGRAGRRR